MSGVRMTLNGGEEMRARLESTAAQFPLEARRGANVWIKRKLAITQERVPVKLGLLKATGRVSVELRKTSGGKAIDAWIEYGSAEVPYAFEVHENLEAKHPGGGQAKYVSSVMMEAAATAGAELAAEIDLKVAARK